MFVNRKLGRIAEAEISLGHFYFNHGEYDKLIDGFYLAGRITKRMHKKLRENSNYVFNMLNREVIPFIWQTHPANFEREFYGQNKEFEVTVGRTIRKIKFEDRLTYDARQWFEDYISRL